MPYPDLSQVKVTYRTTLEMVDKDTGEQRRKVWKDGVLIEDICVQPGVAPAGVTP